MRPHTSYVAAAFVAVLACAAIPAQAAPPPWASHLFADQQLDAAAPDTSVPSTPTPPPAAKRPCPCKDPTTRARKLKCFPELVGHDIARVFTAPARWRAKQWGIFSAEVLGVGLVAVFDDQLRTAVLRSNRPIANDIATIFEPFGTWASFVVLAGFYVGGAAAKDDKARGVALDGLSASIIASVIITPTLKIIFGRSRPNQDLGPYDFHPFHGGASFPSGHVTQAFAVASVIATEYKQPWVQVVCYVPATLVGYARMRHDAHWGSDVVAGALIGYGVGQAVARLNLPPRMGAKSVRFVPVLAPGAQGVAVTASW